VDSPAAGKRDVLVDVGSRTQKVANLVEGAAEAMSRIEILEPAHRPVASFYPSVILFDHVVFILAGAVIDIRAEFVGDGLGVALSTWHHLRLVRTIFGSRWSPEAHKSTSKLTSKWIRIARIKVASAQVDSAPATPFSRRRSPHP